MIQGKFEPLSPQSQRARVESRRADAHKITHIGSWEWVLASNVVSWSDELYRIYGFEPQSREITYEFFVSRLHPDDRERVMRDIHEALARGGRFSYVERVIHSDGTTRYLDTVGEVATSETGEVLGLIGTCRDVTAERERDETIELYANIVENVQIALTVWHVGAPDSPRDSTLVAFNPAAERAARRQLSESVGKPAHEIFPRLAETCLLQILTRVVRDGSVHELHEFSFEPTPGRTQAFSVKAFPLPGACVGLAMEEVTVASRARRLREVEQAALEMIASGDALENVLAALALMVEEQAPPTIGSIQLLDAAGKRLLHAAAPHLPEAYNAQMDGLPIGPRAGSCGTAAYLRRAVFVSDIASDPLWVDFAEHAVVHGLRACWSTPIFSSTGRVLGTFAMYYREPRNPTSADLEVIARATHVAGLAIQRREVDEQLRALSARIEAVREEERTTIAREVHDDLGQALTALKLDVAWLERNLGQRGGAPRETIASRLSGMSELTDQVIDRVRQISAELRPGVLDDLGLVAALQWQGQRFQDRTELKCSVRSTIEDRRLERELSTAIFRICQEALTNVARHASAASVEIVLEQRAGLLRLTVRDDGVGISEDDVSSKNSLGLLGMRERARRLGGTVAITGEPSRGTFVVVEVPYEAHRETLP